MCITTFCGEFNPPLKTLQLVVSEVLMLHENTEILNSVEPNDPSHVNIDPTEGIILVLIGIPVRNQTVCVEVVK